MPKRRAAPEEHPASSTSPPRRRRVDDDVEPSASPLSGTASPGPETQTQSMPHRSLIKKMVRYALSCEYARQPIRRGDISTKVLGDAGTRQFKVVFEGAQKELKATFGMQMTELPVKEKTNLNQRRAAQSQVKAPSSTTKAYILTSTLPAIYKTAFFPGTTHRDELTSPLLPPAKAPNSSVESAYIGLYTFVIALILLSPTQSIPEAKLDRYLRRMNADIYMMEGVGGKKEEVLKRMEREGYLERRREVIAGEEGVDYIVGGRGKLEVGVEGVKGLVRGVYGLENVNGVEEGEEDEREADGHVEKQQELESRLARSLGLSDRAKAQNPQDREDADRELESQARTDRSDTRTGPGRKGRGRPPRSQRDSRDDDAS